MKKIVSVLIAVATLVMTGCKNDSKDEPEQKDEPKESVQTQTPSQDEIELHRLIMEYRAQNGLPYINLSKSLTYVAQVHAKDVYLHFDEIPEGCNAHSWSSHGNWKKCDYYPDHRNAELMWSKPRELTSYTGNGYEIIYYCLPPTSGVCTPQGALEGWKKSSPHNNTILNLDIWAQVQWKAIGVGMYKGVAAVWFGETEDPDGYYTDVHP